MGEKDLVAVRYTVLDGNERLTLPGDDEDGFVSLPPGPGTKRRLVAWLDDRGYDEESTIDYVVDWKARDGSVVTERFSSFFGFKMVTFVEDILGKEK